MKDKDINSYLKREFWLEKKPQFFNFKFQLLTYATAAIFLLYSILSIPLYIFYHLFGDLGLFLSKEEIDSNNLLKYYQLNDISLFWNIFNIFIPIGLLFFSLNLTSNQTYAFYAIYMGILKLFIFAYFMNCNLTLITHKSSFIFRIFNLMILFTYSLFSFYSIFYYIKNKNPSNNNNINNKETSFGKYTINLNKQPASIETLVHVVQLKMDMAKIKFNSLMIKLKLHKIFKRLLYQPKDFYFMSNNLEKERQNGHIIRNIKGLNKINDGNKFSDSSSQNSDNISTTNGSSIDNNYTRLEDDETEPLKI